ncbi:MAG: DUF1641 domain-containing protein [Sideroxyarcus sp.]|nr:DUF1641 domain-containing protein [Sideroxyarcus sp.]
MTTLLLDYRWELVDALNNPDVSVALRKFVNLLRRTGLNPAPFIEDHQQDEMWLKLGQEPPRNGEWQQLMEFLDLCRRPDGSMCRAVPDHEATGISDNWKRALRDQLITPLDWRTPHIVVPESRLTEWGTHENEVTIRCEKCNGQPASGPHHRVLAILERYESHPFAAADLDPWGHLEWLKRPQPDARVNYPCRLPKPPVLDGVPLEELFQALVEVRNNDWQINGRYYFIPRADFHPEQVSKEDWRNGAAFKRKTINTPKGKKTGPIDFGGRIWVWDIYQERHWDVQLPSGGWMNISHDGRLIR